jgi:hypothetical protein
MSTVRIEPIQPQSSQDLARQRLTASRQDILLYTHLIQASLTVERDNPLRRALSEHRQLARNVAVTFVILLSVMAGLIAPQIVQMLQLL